MAPNGAATDGMEGETGEPPQPGFSETEDADVVALRNRLEVQRLEAEIARQTALAGQLHAQTEFLTAETALKKQDKPARATFMWVVGLATVAQLVVANWVFVLYAKNQPTDWDVPVLAISAWLGATMVQVIAVLIIVANNLFPRRDNPQLAEALTRSTPISEAPDRAQPPAPRTPE